MEHPSADKAAANAAAQPAQSTDTKLKPVSYVSLFRYATWVDVAMLVAACLCAMANGIVFPLFSLIMSGLLDSFFANDIMSTVGAYALYMLYIAIASLVLSLVQIGVAMIQAERQGIRIRDAYLRAILRQEAGYHDTHDMGEVSTRISGDVLNIVAGMGEKLTNGIQHGTSFVAGLIMAFIRGWDLTLVVLSLVPILVLGAGSMQYVLGKLQKGEQDGYAAAGAAASEAIAGIRTVAAYGGEEAEAARYARHLKKSETAGIKKAAAIGGSLGTLQFGILVSYGVGLYYGAVRILKSREENPLCRINPLEAGCYTGGTVMNVFFATIIAAFSIAQAGPAFAAAAQACAAAARVFAVIDRVPEIDNFPPQTAQAGKRAGVATANDTADQAPIKLDPATVAGRIEFRNVTFAYPSRPDQPVLRDFSLVIEPGITVALVGASGSGKSTLVALLERLYDPQSGSVLLDGVDARKYDLHSLRDAMGLVSQEPTLFAATVKQNIALGKTRGAGPATDEEVTAAAVAANAHAFVMRLPKGYDTSVGTSASTTQLSGGQKQRVAIARALIRNPRILLLDEATSALDTTSERVVQAAIDKLITGASATKRTTLMIAHRLSTVVAADTIVVLEKGVIVESGSHSALMAQEGSRYRALRAMQAIVESHASSSAIGDGLAEHGGHAEESHLASASSSAAGIPPSESVASLSSLASLRPDAAVEAATAPTAAAAAPAADRKTSKANASPAKAPKASKAKAGGKEGDDDDEEEEDVADLPPVPFSRVWAYQKPEAAAVVLAVIAVAIAGAGMPVFSIIFSRMINFFYSPSDDVLRTKTAEFCGYFVMLGVVAFVSQVTSQFLWGYVGEKLTVRLRTAVYRHLLRQEIAFFDVPQHSVGRLTSKLAADAALVKGSTGGSIASGTMAIASMTTGLVISFVASWQLALLVLAIFPLLALTGVMQMKMLAGFTDASEDEEPGHVAAEATSGYRTVAAFNLQAHIMEAFDRAQQPRKARMVGKSLTAGGGMGASLFVLFGTYGLTFFVGGALVQRGYITFQDMLQSLFGIIMAAQSLGQATAMATDLGKAEKAKRSIFALLDRKSAIDPMALAPVEALPADTAIVAVPGAGSSTAEALVLPLLPAPAVPCTGRISFVDLHFTYPTRPDVPVLRGFSLTVEPGKLVALVGPSGCGKSSLIGLLLRYYDPASGSILLDGVDIRRLPVAWLRSQMAIVAQEPALWGDSIAYNIGYGCAGEKPAPDKGVSVDAGADADVPQGFAVTPDVVQASKDANAHDFIAGFRHGFATHVGARGSQLSGGQKQRVAIARAIIRNPRILLLDEATSALDSQSERVVQAALDRLLAESTSSRTSLVIAHRLSTIKNADTICVINEGRVAEVGSHDALLATGGVYASLVRAQDGDGRSAQEENASASGVTSST